MTYTQWFQSWAGEGFGWFLSHLSLILLIALPVMLTVAMIIYAERKLWAAFALRRGPNVVGPLGVLQSFADGLKVFLQETIIPTASNRRLFLIAPIITFTVALIVWAVIPFQKGVVLTDINVGLLYILAASSLGVYGIIIAGWASNSKYPFYSALRAAAQMVSYEVSIGFILISIVLWAGTFNMTGIVEAQKDHVFGINAFALNPLLFPMAVLFFISSLAETARAPFDLTEAESELVAGYQTEYSSMAFALYWLGEYANVILMCVLNAVLFWGGYLPPIDWEPLYAVPGFIWLLLKFLIFFFLFAWVKATVPRFRYDQLMRLGWKVFLPISLFWVFLVSGYLMMTRFDSERPSKTNVAAMMRSSRASDACSFTREKRNGREPQSPLVILQRPKDFDFNGEMVIRISHPDRLAGRYRFKLDKTNGYGGSGKLVAFGKAPEVELSMAVYDVIREDGRADADLQIFDGKDLFWDGCASARDLGVNA
jgi:NADH-quinone oxidoreductase subunit H